jgi:hypothetical protein
MLRMFKQRPHVDPEIIAAGNALAFFRTANEMGTPP